MVTVRTNKVSMWTWSVSDRCEHTGGQNACNADPGEPTDLAESLYTCQRPSSYGRHRHKYGSTGAVAAECVEGGRNSEHGCSSAEDPKEHEGGAHDDTTRFASDLLTDIIDTVDGRVVELEHTHDVVGPSCDASDGEQADETWYQTEDIKVEGNGQDAQSNLGLHHEHGSSQPADLRRSQSNIWKSSSGRHTFR